jgi:hypothetical protein
MGGNVGDGEVDCGALAVGDGGLREPAVVSLAVGDVERANEFTGEFTIPRTDPIPFLRPGKPLALGVGNIKQQTLNSKQQT